MRFGVFLGIFPIFPCRVGTTTAVFSSVFSARSSPSASHATSPFPPPPSPLPAPHPLRLSLWSRTETSFTFCRDSALALDAPHPAAPSALLAIPAREGRAVLVGTLCQPTRSEEEVDPDATWTYDARFIVDRMLVEEAERDRGIDRRADEARKGEGEEGGREGGGAEAGGARGDATACALFRAPSGAPLLLVGWDGGLVDLFDLPGLEAAGEGSEEGKGQTSSTPPSVALSGLSLEPRTTASSAPHPRRLLDPLSTLRVQAKAPVLALAAAGATCAAVGASSRGALFDLGRPKKKKEKTGGAGEREGSGKGVEDDAGEREPLVAVAPASARRVAASAPPPVFSLRHPRPFRLPREGANDVALRRDGRVAVAACWDGVVRAVDAETGETVGKLKRHADQVAAVRYSPSGRLLATAGGEGGIALWIAARGAEKVRLFLGAS